VRRLMLSLFLALLVHGLFFSSKAEWLKKEAVPESEPKILTLSISHKSHEVSPQIKRIHVEAPSPREIHKVSRSKKNVHPSDKVSLSKEILESSAVSDPGHLTEEKSSDMPSTFSVNSSGLKEHVFSTEQDSEIAGVPVKRPFPEITIRARPVYRKNPSPEYPGLARKRGYQGTVFLEALVGADGNVKDLRLLVSSGHPMLDKSALESVKKWVFKPGMRGGQRVEMWVRIPIRFQLK